MALRLTWEVLEVFGGRKTSGLLSVFVDARTGQIHPVPIGIEHKAFAAKLLGTTVDEIIRHPETGINLIPSNIIVEDGQIVAVGTGISGLELYCNVKHYIDDIKKVHGIVWGFINDGEVPVGKLRENKISDAFAIK